MHCDGRFDIANRRYLVRVCFGDIDLCVDQGGSEHDVVVVSSAVQAEVDLLRYPPEHLVDRIIGDVAVRMPMGSLKEVEPFRSLLLERLMLVRARMECDSYDMSGHVRRCSTPSTLEHAIADGFRRNSEADDSF